MVKPLRIVSEKKITYTEEHWKLFNDLRESASQILSALEKQGIEALVHGSVARGDVNKDSDIDIIIPQTIPSFKVELALRKKGFISSKRELVMATPWQLPKAHISLSESQMVTFPLLKPKRLELEFYRFGGAVGLTKANEKERVPGVDKRLVLIEPIEDGHQESQVIGRENEVAKQVGVSVDIVQERVQVLTRRDKIGRTGVFLQRELTPEENFETVLKRIADKNPEVKRRFKEKQD